MALLQMLNLDRLWHSLSYSLFSCGMCQIARGCLRTAFLYSAPRQADAGRQASTSSAPYTFPSLYMQIQTKLHCAMQWFTDFATCPPKEAMDLPFGQVHEGFALALGLESSDSWDPAKDPLLPARKVCTS